MTRSAASLLLLAGLASCQDEVSNVGSAEQSIVLELPLWTTDPSDLSLAQFGSGLSGNFDANGDGFGDVVVSAPGWDGIAEDEGRIYLYMGSPRGLPTTPDLFSDPTDTLQAGLQAVAGLGDINGDGFGDFAALSTTQGLIYFYHGAALGPSAVPSETLAVPFASTIAAAGDVNGDGFADLIVGARGFDGEALAEGQARVFFGSATGIEATSVDLDPTDQESAFFGTAVAGAGDLNGDGFADVAISAPGWDGNVANEGRVDVFLGSASGLVPGWILEPSNQDGSNFGASLSGAGDVNGDGLADLLVGAPNWSDTVAARGRVYLFHGEAQVGATREVSFTTSPVDQISANFGASVAGIGDVNGDGFSDLTVGVPGFDPAPPLSIDVGQMLLFVGRSEGLDPEIAGVSNPPMAIGSFFGKSVAFAGDVNGDGLGDAMGGSETAEGGVIDEGQVLGFYGSLPQPPAEVGPERIRAMQQQNNEDASVLPPGATTDSPTVALSARVVQEAPIGGLLRLEVELKQFGQEFDGLGLVQSELYPTGAIASVALSELEPGEYRWRARIVFPVGTGRSRWINFAGDLATAPDFILVERPTVLPEPPEPPEKIGFYDCQTAVGGSRRGAGAVVAASFLLLGLLILRRRTIRVED